MFTLLTTVQDFDLKKKIILMFGHFVIAMLLHRDFYVWIKSAMASCSLWLISKRVALENNIF